MHVAAVFSTSPRPRDIKQPFWHTTCYVMVTLQAIAARHPGHLRDMVDRTAHGWRVRHYGISRPLLLDKPGGGRLLPAAEGAPGHTLVCGMPAATSRWAIVMRQAYLTLRAATVRNTGFPDNVLYWAFGCKVQTALLPRGPDRAVALASLARMFAAGECVVFFVAKHCWALVGASVHGAAETPVWHLTLSDPRALRRTFSTTSHADTVLHAAYAYAVTLGASSCVPRPDFFLDKHSDNA